MKYIEKYENYKSSSKFGDEITEKEFNKLLHKNCKNYKNQEIKLYRGIYKDLSEYYYQNPRNYIRHSIEPQNIHVTIMSESDKWKNFPTYNQSIIGTTDINVAYLYSYNNNIFEIIPYDNTKIGICPKGTIWSSFGGFSNIDKIKLTDNFLKYFLNVYDDDWGAIQDEIEKINNVENRIIELYNKDKDKDNYILSFINELIYHFNISISEITPKKIINYIEYLFDPKRNNFNWLKYDNSFSKNMENIFTKLSHSILQVWCEGPILLKQLEKNI